MSTGLGGGTEAEGCDWNMGAGGGSNIQTLYTNSQAGSVRPTLEAGVLPTELLI